MSRLSELILQLKRENPDLGKEIEKEVRHLQDRRAFGLNFERHRPETVELYGRPVRKGDKVKMLPPRGETKASDDRLWIVIGAKKVDGARIATLKDRRAEETTEYPIDDLVVVAESHDTIYPGLVSTGKIERGGDKPFHTVINGENLHALKMLLYTHRGKVDAIYIDPPYNTGARDWKYNNDYVESDDIYRHSKWLAFMERRLLAAKELLNPDNSALIVTIDEKEYLRLGLLLEQIFPEARIQMVTSVVNRKGIIRSNELTRTNEFIYFVTFGKFAYSAAKSESGEKVRWASLRRMDIESRRGTAKGGQAQFFPIYVSQATGRITKIGDPIPPEVPRSSIDPVPGSFTLWPLRPDGTEMNWGLTPETVRKRWESGFVKVVPGRQGKLPTLYYLTSGQVRSIKDGGLVITGQDSDGSAIVEFATGKSALPTTQWDRESHNAQSHGTGILASLLRDRKFPFPKSLYAVEDCMRLVVGAKREAVVVDFFSGSGTTAHALMRLNRQDGGHRQCISVTNNEVSAAEQQGLRESGLRPGDPAWEALGICEHITKPRIEAAITGRAPDGNPIKGTYKFTDEFPMAEGFEASAGFFTLTYEAPLNVATHHAFERIAPMLWLRAGAIGRRIDDLEKGWDVADAYGVIADLDHLDDFREAINAGYAVKMAYIVTDDHRQFAATCAALPEHVEPVRLYESYLRNFQIDARRSSR